MNTQKFTIWLSLGLVSGGTFWFSLLFLVFNIHPEAGRWIYECLQKKTIAVQQIQPKLIILSGSNSLFGFSAEQLTNRYGVPSVNAAIHAGLGLDYILDYGKKMAAPGRVFVLPLEYQLYGTPTSGGAYVFQVVGFDTEYFWSMSVVKKIRFAMGISWRDLMALLKNRFIPLPRDDTGGYQSRTLNTWGDETNNVLGNRTTEMVHKVNVGAKAVKFNIDEHAWDKLAEFVRYVRSGGGNVVLAYPNIYANYLDTQLNSEFFSDLKWRAKSIDVKLIGNPDAARYDESSLFDSVYHQNTIGQSKATDRLYKDLRAGGII